MRMQFNLGRILQRHRGVPFTIAGLFFIGFSFLNMQAQTCVPVASGLVSSWSAESNTLDNVGGNTGILLNGATYASGEQGLAFSFNGSSQAVRIPDAPNLRFTNGLTAEVWVFPNGNPTGNPIVKYDYFPQNNQSCFAVGFNPDFTFSLLITTNGGSSSVLATSVHSVPGNTWSHLAATYDGTALRLYLNGSLETTLPFIGTLFPGKDDMGIGGNVGGSGVAGAFSGLIDEPAVYNRALSDSEIQDIYNAGAVGKCPADIPPAIYVQPVVGSTNNPGANVTFGANITGSLPMTTQWLLNGISVPGATNRTITISNAQPMNAGNYSLFLSNSAGFTLSSNALLKIPLVTILGNGVKLTNSQYTFASPVTIQITNFYKNGYIFYTLDGSTPTPASAFYTGSFVVSNSSTIQTLAFTPDFLQSVASDPVLISLPQPFALSVTTPGGGTVVANPSSSPYPSNTLVTLTATPASGWSFLQWQGDISGTAATNALLMNRNKSIQAIFGTTVGSTAGGGGSVLFNPSGGVYPYGSTLQATAVPQAGNYFVTWGNSAAGNANPLTYLVTNSNPVISALFFTLSGSKVTLEVEPFGHGSVSVNPPTNIYNIGQSVTITATPNSGKAFLGWSGSASGTNNPLTVVMNQSKTIYANFSTNNSLSLRLVAGNGTSQGIVVDLNGELGTHYRLDASSNLVNWTALFNLTNSVGTLHFIDTNASNFNSRYYRGVILP